MFSFNTYTAIPVIMTEKKVKQITAHYDQRTDIILYAINSSAQEDELAKKILVEDTLTL